MEAPEQPQSIEVDCPICAAGTGSRRPCREQLLRVGEERDRLEKALRAALNFLERIDADNGQEGEDANEIVEAIRAVLASRSAVPEPTDGIDYASHALVREQAAGIGPETEIRVEAGSMLPKGGPTPTVEISDQMRAAGPDPAVEREAAATIARELRDDSRRRVRGPVDHMLKQPRREITDE